MKLTYIICVFCCLALDAPAVLAQDVAVRAKTIHTMAGEPIQDGVVIIRDGKISAIGPAARTQIPQGMKTLEANVVTPGLIDAHGTLGLTGIHNEEDDQDQLDRSGAIQPELRAIDAYNALDKLVEYVRGFGTTTVHTGHAPGALISGQTCIVKLRGNTIEEAVVKPEAMIAAALGEGGRREQGSPGTRGKMLAMLRQELIKAQEYQKKAEVEDEKRRPPRDLKLEMLSRVLKKEVSLLITADRAQDIASALRLAKEFEFNLVLDSCAEAYLLLDDIKAAGVPVIIHPSMQRSTGEKENASFETAAKLREAGIPVAMQTSFEGYVPKVRVILFEAALTLANGNNFEQALALITRDAAKILGIADRVGTIEVGKDGDLALFDGDPFEYTTHCIGTIIDGRVLHDQPK